MIEDNNRVKGAKSALLNSLLYYYRALELCEVNDINRQIATDVSLMLKLTKEQTEFIANTEVQDLKGRINDIIILLNTLEYKNIEIKNLIINSLEDLKKKIIKI